MGNDTVTNRQASRGIVDAAPVALLIGGVVVHGAVLDQHRAVPVEDPGAAESTKGTHDPVRFCRVTYDASGKNVHDTTGRICEAGPGRSRPRTIDVDVDQRQFACSIDQRGTFPASPVTVPQRQVVECRVRLEKIEHPAAEAERTSAVVHARNDRSEARRCLHRGELLAVGDRVRQIQHRQALLTYGQHPRQTLDYLQDQLDLRFDHQQETVDRAANIFIVLDTGKYRGCGCAAPDEPVTATISTSL